MRTLQIDVAANFIELYESTNTEVILVVLIHKVLRKVPSHANVN